MIAVMRGHRPRILMAIAASTFTAAVVLRPMTIEVTIPASGPPEPEVAQQILVGLLDNISVAMLEPSDALFQTTLVPFVLHEKMAEVGAEIRRGLAVTLPTGALARTDYVQNIEIQEITAPGAKNESRIFASWTASVIGGHWGHQHRRFIEYRALLDIVSKNGSWKLTGLTILEARTLDTTQVNSPIS